jgi:hypothetical protein
LQPNDGKNNIVHYKETKQQGKMQRERQRDREREREIKKERSLTTGNILFISLCRNADKRKITWKI